MFTSETQRTRRTTINDDPGATTIWPSFVVWPVSQGRALFVAVLCALCVSVVKTPDEEA